MSKLVIPLKCVLSTAAISGAFIASMGLGVVPLDPHMASIANVFVEPLSVPLKPFLAFLGTCKVLGAASLWGLGPMPRSVGVLGLTAAATCGAIGHVVVGDPPFPAVAYVGMMGAFCVLEGREKAAKTE